MSDTNSQFWQQFQQAVTSPKRSRRQMLTPRQGKQQLWSSFEQAMTLPIQKVQTRKQKQTPLQTQTKRNQSQRMMDIDPELQANNMRSQVKPEKKLIVLDQQQQQPKKQKQTPKAPRHYVYYSGGLGMKSAPFRATLERLG